MNDLIIVLLMDKISQITIDNSLNVVVTCQVDQNILAKNFATILNALKELQQGQLKNESHILDLNLLKDKCKILSDKIEKLQLASQSSSKEVNSGLSKQNSNQSASNNSQDLFNAITKRLDKSQSSILDSIKDINVLTKDLSDVRKQIANLKNTTSNFKNKELNNSGENQGNLNEKGGYGIQQIAQNMSKQLSQKSEQMKELQGRLSKAQNHILKLKEELAKMSKDYSKNLAQTQQSNDKEGKYSQMKQQFKDKIDTINQKIKNIQLQTSHNNQQISNIKEILSQNQNQNNQSQGKAENQISSNSTIKSDIAQLKKRIEEVNSRENKDVKKINDDIANLKLAIKGFKGGNQRGENIQSNTSIEEQADNRSGRMSQKQFYDRINQKLNDLVLKVNYLQKMISNGSKKLIGSDQKTTGGFPVISRHKKRGDPNATGLQQKERLGIGRKDLAQLKADLEAWIKSLFDKGHEQQNIQDFYLKIQEIKHSLQKKADAEGTKKGLAFLQGKITQLFLFLTEPETEDAMIARKGFNCLSCSKKVEKLRGRLGPRLNWNNMTSTNYSPPRVGYSKPMGQQNSIEKQDDL